MIKGSDIVQIGSNLLYILYYFGAETRPVGGAYPLIPDRTDCSEYVEHVMRILDYFKVTGERFPDGSWNQYRFCSPKINLEEAKHYAGALVFNRGSSSGKINHVGISTGTGCTIEAVSRTSGLPGSGMVNIYPWRSLWDLAGLIPGVEYERWG